MFALQVVVLFFIEGVCRPQCRNVVFRWLSVIVTVLLGSGQVGSVSIIRTSGLAYAIHHVSKPKYMVFDSLAEIRGGMTRLWKSVFTG